jgi:hypothetical protein
MARHDRRGARLPELIHHPIFQEIKNVLGGGMKTKAERAALDRLANTLNSYGYSDLAIWIALGMTK